MAALRIINFFLSLQSQCRAFWCFLVVCSASELIRLGKSFDIFPTNVYENFTIYFPYFWLWRRLTNIQYSFGFDFYFSFPEVFCRVSWQSLSLRSMSQKDFQNAEFWGCGASRRNLFKALTWKNYHVSVFQWTNFQGDFSGKFEGFSEVYAWRTSLNLISYGTEGSFQWKISHDSTWDLKIY